MPCPSCPNAEADPFRLRRRVTQDLSVSPVYDAVFWNPPQKYQFKNKRPAPPRAVKVYEAHGMLSSA